MPSTISPRSRARWTGDVGVLLKQLAPHLTRKWEMLFTVLGFEEKEIKKLREEFDREPCANLLEEGLNQWRERHGNQANIGALVMALRDAELNQQADFVEQYCGRLQKFHPYPVKEEQLEDKGFGHTKRFYGINKTTEGGVLQGVCQVMVTDRKENELVRQTSQPLLGAWTDHVTEHKQQYAQRITEELDIEGAEVSDITEGWVESETQGIVIIDVFCHHLQAYNQLKVVDEEGVMDNILRRMLLDDEALYRAGLWSLPLQVTWYVAEEKWQSCEEELRGCAGEVEEDDADKQTTMDEEQNHIENRRRKMTLSLEVRPVGAMEYSATYQIKGSPTLTRVTAVPGVDNVLAALDTNSKTIYLLHSARDKYTPYHKLIRVRQKFSGAKDYKLSAPCGITAFGEFILVAEKFTRKILVFDVDGKGVNKLSVEMTPVDICCKENHLWVVGEGKIDIFKLNLDDGLVKAKHKRRVHTGYLRPTGCAVSGNDDILFVGSETNANNKIAVYILKNSLINKEPKIIRKEKSSLWCACAYGSDVFTFGLEVIEKIDTQETKPWKDSEECEADQVIYKGENRELWNGLTACFDHQGELLIMCKDGMVLVLEKIKA